MPWSVPEIPRFDSKCLGDPNDRVDRQVFSESFDSGHPRDRNPQLFGYFSLS